MIVGVEFIGNVNARAARAVRMIGCDDPIRNTGFGDAAGRHPRECESDDTLKSVSGVGMRHGRNGRSANGGGARR